MKRANNSILNYFTKKTKPSSDGDVSPQVTLENQGGAVLSERGATDNAKPCFDVQKSPAPQSKPKPVMPPSPVEKRGAKLKEEAPKSPAPSKASSDGVSFTHLKLKFLDSDERRDSNKRKPSHPDFDSSTLYVPETFLNSLTPAMRQWWILKAEHMDTLLFFKMGKFYELFHMDAVTAVEESNGLLAMMKGDYAHCGFPEIAFERYANVFIEKGFKVARIEQTETPKMMEERCKKMSKASKFDKVVNRSVCQRVSVGTRTFSDNCDHCLLAITEGVTTSGRTVGLAVANASFSRIYFGQVLEDDTYSKVRTLLTFLTPSEVIVERKCLSPALEKLIDKFLPLRKTSITFPEAEEILNCNHFGDEWPECVTSCLGEGRSSVKSDSQISVKALAAIVDYFRDAMIDDEVVAFGDIRPMSSLMESDNENATILLPGSTISNLELVPGASKRGKSLFDLLSMGSSTPGGKRLLKKWICSPPANIDFIVQRQKAMQDLDARRDLVSEFKGKMKNLCDFERMLARLYAAWINGSEEKEKAIFYDAEQRLEKSVKQLVACLQSLEDATKMLTKLSENAEGLESTMLATLVSQDVLSEAAGVFERFRDMFDYDEALSSGKIVLHCDTSTEMDECRQARNDFEARLEKYRVKQSKHFHATVSYSGTGNAMYQLEVEEASAMEHATDEHTLSSQKKGYRRYVTPIIEQFRQEREDLDDATRKAVHAQNRGLFRTFCDHRRIWQLILAGTNNLDCLISIFEYSYNGIPGESSFPRFLGNNDTNGALLRIEAGRHPILDNDQFIPNDVVLDHNVVVLTGANMGGKSTVMRQCALLCLLAHLGCRVPAAAMELTPLDAVLSRMGANDNIMEGESTFFVELSETMATSRSLVLIDELGRGTATSDGCAIAAATLSFLQKVGCRTLFSTHYHQLLASEGMAKSLRLQHMAIVEPSEEVELTFLYKLVDGMCSLSHGFNAAQKAGLGKDVISRGRDISKAMNMRSNTASKFVQVFNI